MLHHCPHAYAVDFSIGRELPKRFSLQLSYVGRFGHRLLTQRDLAQPLDIVDPKTGIDYYTGRSCPFQTGEDLCHGQPYRA
jgi:hypothetical protein